RGTRPEVLLEADRFLNAVHWPRATASPQPRTRRTSRRITIRPVPSSASDAGSGTVGATAASENVCPKPKSATGTQENVPPNGGWCDTHQLDKPSPVKLPDANKNELL